MEAVTNVQRHANASACIVRLNLDDTAAVLCVEVQDNGCGIAPQQSAGVGLTAMRERTAELGGQFTVESAANGGTHIHARLPFTSNGKS